MSKEASATKSKELSNQLSAENPNEMGDDLFEFDKGHSAQDLAKMAKVISTDEIVLEVFEGQ